MVGSIIGGGLNVLGSVFGGIAASKAAKKAKNLVEEQQDKIDELRQENQNWYDRRYNEDATQRADAQRILKMTEESIRNRNRQAAGAQAVMGGTEESVAAAKAANSQALANAAAQIAAAGDARKAQIEQTYFARDDNYQSMDNDLQNQLANIETQRGKNIAKAVQGVAEAGSKIAEAF